MTVQEVLAICNGSLTGDLQTDIAALQARMQKYAHEPNSEELLSAINDLAFSLLPKEQQDQFLETTCINGKRLDAVFADARKMVDDKRYQEAALTLHSIMAKSEQYFGEGSKIKYYSFRNPFEYHLFRQLYGTEQEFDRAPFDFCMFLTLYGYVLVELHRLEEAIDTLEKAIAFNPVNCDTRFELCEAFKLTMEPEKLLASIRDLVPIANSTYAISRVYANLGYYCIEIKDYDAAACFYYESLLYADHPGVQGELVHLRSLTGKRISPPTREEVLATFEKYDIPNGPSRELVALSVTLADQAIKLQKTELGAYFYTIAYDLTRDEDIKMRLESLKKRIDAEKAAGITDEIDDI